MAYPAAIPKGKRNAVVGLYKEGLSMQGIANKYKVSIGAVMYILRKTKTARRSFREANRIVFENKKPSFSIRKGNSARGREMDLLGAALYWAEGYKTSKAMGIDFANSDPDMAQVFLRFLRTRYVLDPARLYCQIYYYADQDIGKVTSFWSKKLGLPRTSFRSPYEKRDFKPNAKKLAYGVVHIRYGDKKMLWDVLNLIKSCKMEFCVGG